MINIKDILIGSGFYLIAHCFTWFQLNSQFFSKWAKDHWIILTLVTSPIIGLIFVWGTRVIYSGFGNLWSGRILGFCIGNIVFALLTWLIMNEGVNLKTWVSLGLCLIIIGIQLLWK